MNSKLELPDEVLEALHRNRKIEAIKLLRNGRNLGLKEAKLTIDEYLAANPHLFTESGLQEKEKISGWVGASIIGVLLYMAYHFFA